MRKFLKVVLILAAIGLNVVAIIPGLLPKPVETQQAPTANRFKLQLPEVHPVILPNLIKL